MGSKLKILNFRFFWLLLFSGLFLCITGQFIGNELFTFFQKLVLLFSILLLTFIYGFSTNRIAPLCFFTLAVIVSTIGASIAGVWVDSKLIAVTYFSLGMPFLLYSINLDRRVVFSLSNVLIFLPLMSLGIGFLFIPFGIDPWVIEYSGAFRLRGAAIPPHLAMLCVVAIFIQCFYLFNEIRFKNDFFILFLNFFILYLTATRGPLIAALLSMMPLIKKYLSKDNPYSEVFFVVLLLIGALFIYFGYENFVLRNAESSVEEPFNLSGRAIAWDYFISIVQINPFFGTGLGSVTSMTQNELENNLANFVVPHNEYIRFSVDVGIVGAFLIFIPNYIYSLNRVLKVQKQFALPVIFSLLATAIYAASDNLLSTVQFSLPFSVFCLMSFGDTRWNQNR